MRSRLRGLLWDCSASGWRISSLTHSLPPSRALRSSFRPHLGRGRFASETRSCALAGRSLGSFGGAPTGRKLHFEAQTPRKQGLS